VLRDGGQWHLWASVHPLDDPNATDRMTIDYATSPDGLVWVWHGTVLSGRPNAWTPAASGRLLRSSTARPW
jgi:hypothetical protein